MSGTIKNMLSVDFAEGASNTCHIMERYGDVLLCKSMRD